MTVDYPFVFDAYAFDHDTGVLTLSYHYQNGAAFTETVRFPAPTRAMGDAEWVVLDRLFRLLFLFAGVSYYKAYVPATLICDAFPLDPATAKFVQNVYAQGLGEFAYRNNLDLRDRIKFHVDDATPSAPVTAPIPAGLMVPVGGGKDSAVTIEVLKKSGLPVTLFVLTSPAGVAAPIADCVRVAALPSATVVRTLSPAIIELNKAGAYNGHVPITAILSVIALITAVINGADTVVMSNEHSASAPNLVHNGMDVNHQYSKSIAFEQDLASYIAQTITPNLHYFSLLRPLSEVAIMQRFAKLMPYHPVFRSCNTAFRQDAKERGTHWCGNCPKCRFVFMGLAPFMDRDNLIAIFGKNMLNDVTQTDGFAALCGFGAHKPFECVGEVEESALLMAKISTLPAWQNDAVVKALGAHIAPTLRDEFDTKYNALFTPRGGHRVPANYMELIDAAA